MSRTDSYNLSREGLLEYLAAGATPREQYRVGMELEQLARRRRDGRPLPYDEANPSIRGVLESYLERRGGVPVMEGDHLIGIDGDWGAISLEPGGQVEWSSRPQATLGLLRGELEDHQRTIRTLSDGLSVDFLEVAVEPELPVGEMCWMPKARYAIMRPFLGARGRLAHRMMTQTAAIQCAFDYHDPQDWARKFRAAALLAPISTAVFANSSRVDGADSGYRSFRQAIWRETDPERCGLPAIVFEPGFGMERWLDWVLDVPTIFRHRSRGLSPTDGVPFRELLECVGSEAVKPEDWETHESTIFTEVRAYTYIEIRTSDLQPARDAIAVPTFWCGVLYNEASLAAALELGRPLDDHGRWLDSMNRAARDGLDAELGGVPLREMARRAMEIAIDGLNESTPCVDDPSASRRHLELLCERIGLEI